jgi:hypothetical protein
MGDGWMGGWLVGRRRRHRHRRPRQRAGEGCARKRITMYTHAYPGAAGEEK